MSLVFVRPSSSFSQISSKRSDFSRSHLEAASTGLDLQAGVGEGEIAKGEVLAREDDVATADAPPTPSESITRVTMAPKNRCESTHNLSHLLRTRCSLVTSRFPRTDASTSKPLQDSTLGSVLRLSIPDSATHVSLLYLPIQGLDPMVTEHEFSRHFSAFGRVVE